MNPFHDPSAGAARWAQGEWVQVLNQGAYAVLTTAYLGLVAGHFLLLRARVGCGLAVLESYGRVSLVLFLCVLMHACDVLAFRWPAVPFFNKVSGLAAVSAALAARKLPEAVRALSAARAGGPGARPESLQLRDAASLDPQRLARVRERLQDLEDVFRRSAWLAESHAAVEQLDRMLTGLDAALGARDRTRVS